MWKVKSSIATYLGTGPMQKQAKTVVIAKNKPLELPSGAAQMRFLLRSGKKRDI